MEGFSAAPLENMTLAMKPIIAIDMHKKTRFLVHDMPNGHIIWVFRRFLFQLSESSSRYPKFILLGYGVFRSDTTQIYVTFLLTHIYVIL